MSCWRKSSLDGFLSPVRCAPILRWYRYARDVRWSPRRLVGEGGRRRRKASLKKKSRTPSPDKSVFGNRIKTQNASATLLALFDTCLAKESACEATSSAT